MTKYTPITFTKLSEAIAYMEDGGYLCQLDSGFAYEIDDYETMTKCWREPLFTKSSTAPWYEKLDGTVENGVLCTGVDGGIFLAIHHDGTFLSSNNHMLYGVTTPPNPHRN